MPEPRREPPSDALPIGPEWEPEVALRRLLRLLQREVRRHDLPVRDIEARIGREAGYLSKVCSGKRGVSLKHFLEVLAALETDPGDFFARAFGIFPDPFEVLDTPAKRTHNREMQLLEKVGREILRSFREEQQREWQERRKRAKR